MGAKIDEKAKRTKFGRFLIRVLTGTDLFFGPGYTPPPLPRRPLLLQYVTGVGRHELTVTVLSNSVLVHCEIWKFDGNGAVLR